MKKWNDMNQLSLLDDSSESELPTRAWEDLTLKAAKTQTAPKIVANAAANPVAQQAAARARNRVFSSKPTLRDMVREYNRPTARTSPIKPSAPAPAEGDFSFQAVDLISIPVIPGKILRPAQAPDADE